LREFSIPGDPAGFTGVAGVHFSNTFVGACYLGGVPQATADLTAGAGAAYLSSIHGGLGSVGSNNGANVPGAIPPAQFFIPAFPNPEVTGYYNSGPNVSNALANGFLNTEKNKRSRTDAANGANNGVTWALTDGRSRLAFSLWIQSQTSPQSHLFVLEVYRDLNNGDKGAGPWGGSTADLTNAQLVYQFGPFKSAVNASTRHANCQSTDPIELPAGCNLFFIARNITDPTVTNNIIGSVRLVA
jgi:hypothetical protein